MKVSRVFNTEHKGDGRASRTEGQASRTSLWLAGSGKLQAGQLLIFRAHHATNGFCNTGTQPCDTVKGCAVRRAIERQIAGAVGIELKAAMKTSKLLTLRIGRTAKIGQIAGARHEPGIRAVDPSEARGAGLALVRSRS